MDTNSQRMAKRLTFSLLIFCALGGCAVYPARPYPASYAGPDLSGQPVYTVPPVYAAPYYPRYYSPYSSPYYAPYYNPLYFGPPASFNFGPGYGGGYRYYGPPYRGGYRGGLRGGAGRRH